MSTDAPEDITQYVPTGTAAELADRGPFRIELTITDSDGEPIFTHTCQRQGLLHELKMRLARRVRKATEPGRCGFFDSDNPGSTMIYQCVEPLPEVGAYFMVTVPGGAVQVPCCPKHRVVLEQRERQFND
jgi:hypothetical protein